MKKVGFCYTNNILISEEGEHYWLNSFEFCKDLNDIITVYPKIIKRIYNEKDPYGEEEWED